MAAISLPSPAMLSGAKITSTNHRITAALPSILKARAANNPSFPAMNIQEGLITQPDDYKQTFGAE